MQFWYLHHPALSNSLIHASGKRGTTNVDWTAGKGPPRSNLACFGSKNGILMKFLNDSASFLLEKLKNHFILTINVNI